MKPREYVYVGDPIPELNAREHADFLLHFQKAILYSLEQRKLLTTGQRERCVIELERQHSRGLNRRQA